MFMQNKKKTRPTETQYFQFGNGIEEKFVWLFS